MGVLQLAHQGAHGSSPLKIPSRGMRLSPESNWLPLHIYTRRSLIKAMFYARLLGVAVIRAATMRKLVCRPYSQRRRRGPNCGGPCSLGQRATSPTHGPTPSGHPVGAQLIALRCETLCAHSSFIPAVTKIRCSDQVRSRRRRRHNPRALISCVAHHTRAPRAISPTARICCIFQGYRNMDKDAAPRSWHLAGP